MKKENFTNSLFNEMEKERYPEFILRDGPYDIDLFDKENRILFILKEYNNTGDHGEIKKYYQEHKDEQFNLIEYCIQGNIPYNSTYGHVACIANLLINRKLDKTLSSEDAKTLLRKISIINVNKYTDGLSESDDKVIKEYIKKNSYYLKKQIEAIEPKNIFICTGSTKSWELIYKIIGIDIKNGWKGELIDIPCSENQNMMIWQKEDKTVYCICHPGYTKTDKWIEKIAKHLNIQ